jgi:MFS family permease
MLGALYLWGLVFIGFSIAVHPWFFLLLNIFNGFCRSFYEPVSQALMADVTNPERRFRVFSLRYTAINIGVAIGPLLGTYLGMAAGHKPFLVTGIIYLVYAAVLHILLNRFGIRKIEGQKKERVKFRTAWNVLMDDLALRFYLLGGIFGTIGYSQMNVTLSQYLEKHFIDGIQLFSWMITTNAITVVLLQMPISNWAEKRTPFHSIVIGNCLYAIGDIGFAFSNGWVTMIASMIVFTLGEILTFPAGSVFVDRLAPDGMRGTYFGAQSFNNLGYFLGPLLGGYLLSSYGGIPLFLTVASVSLSGTLFFWYGQHYYEARKFTSLRM